MTSDFICPWCWIGHQNLKMAIAEAGVDADAVQMQFIPFELNPDLPKEGVNRKAYRSRKFGSWERSQAMDAEVVRAGERAGLTFNYDQVLVTPNTRLAHRLMRWAASQDECNAPAELADAIFTAYFSQGRDIGNVEVLLEITASVGLDADAAAKFLDSGAGEQEVVDQAQLAQRLGTRSVPEFSLMSGRIVISGAQVPNVLARAILAAGEAMED